MASRMADGIIGLCVFTSWPGSQLGKFEGDNIIWALHIYINKSILLNIYNSSFLVTVKLQTLGGYGLRHLTLKEPPVTMKLNDVI